jgi:hypothetical protein
MKIIMNLEACCFKDSVNLREEAVRYHDQTGGKFSRFEFGDAHKILCAQKIVEKVICTFTEEHHEF